MKRILFSLLLFLTNQAIGQSLSVFNIDAGDFPSIKAKFFAFDMLGRQITNLSVPNFKVTEDGNPRKVTYLSCPSPKPALDISSVLVIDVSASMSGNRLEIAKTAATAWINLLDLNINKSECAITSFSGISYINQDFTSDKTALFNGLNTLTIVNGTNYNAAMIYPPGGGILIAKNGKYKRVIVFLTDGNPNFEPATSKIISEANKYNISIYCVTIGFPAPQCLKDFSKQTGGLYFENITTKEEAEACYRWILMTAQGNEPCSIEWQSDISCIGGLTNLVVDCLTNKATDTLTYQKPDTAFPILTFGPETINFQNVTPGLKKDTIDTITALHADFNITNIISSNPAYTITPSNFSLKAGEFKLLTVSYIPTDSGYTNTKFTIENNQCQANFYARGGYPGKRPMVKTLKIIQPNGGEVFVVGMDTVITWAGILPDEMVKIEYSTDNGANWIFICDTATGLKYNWKVPKTPSKNCLARITAKSEFGYCDGIQICNQLWMGCNLDVDHYRNGDPIPQVTNTTEWSNLKTGAWCYYLNDPANGAIYGKLYNWYAIHDPRGLAPRGWHISSDSEWIELRNCIGGSSAGNKLKEEGFAHWNKSEFYSGTNESGFTALPGGMRNFDGGFFTLGDGGNWWSSTPSAGYTAIYMYLAYSTEYMYLDKTSFNDGMSIRCVKDK